MKNILLFISLICLCIPYAHGQMYTLDGSDPWLGASKYDTIAFYNIQVKYELKYLPDSINRDKTNTRVMVLNLSPKGISSFCEYSQEVRDSIYISHTQNGKIKMSDMNRSSKLGGRIYEFYTIIKSWPEKNRLLYKGNAGFDFYTYKETLPDFGWKVDFSQTKTIVGYTCHEAQGSYGGRNYQAWFTTDIPISDGPWKFRGLPGLILEVASTDGDYSFAATSIQKKDGPIRISGISEAFSTTRENFLKALRRSKEAPSSTLSAMGDKIKGNLKTSKKKRAYNPQEKY